MFDDVELGSLCKVAMNPSYQTFFDKIKEFSVLNNPKSEQHFFSILYRAIIHKNKARLTAIDTKTTIRDRSTEISILFSDVTLWGEKPTFSREKRF